MRRLSASADDSLMLAHALGAQVSLRGVNDGNALRVLSSAISRACWSCVATMAAKRGVCDMRCVKEAVGGRVTSCRARSCDAVLR